ncbi:hypothetical protein [Pseudomonas sp. S1(2024)]|uniref:hypothetical protein n=1 Tax=Pseudomonas sp. S1(2024) TaxID=3390191 RepID=UPI00397BE35F
MTTTNSNIELAKNDKLMKMELRLKDDGKIHAFLRETTADGVELPVRMAYVDKIGDGENAFFVVKAPMREKNEDGSFKTRGRQKDGKFLDAQGKEVESEDQAERQFVLLTQRNDPTKLVYGQIGTLNIKNFKVDKTPTAMTLITAKLWSDEDALAAERIAFRMSALGAEHADYPALQQELKDFRRSTGSFADFFINKGHPILRDMGFSIRERVKPGVTSESEPG